MGWKLVGKPKTVKATMAMAKEFVNMDPAPSDRPLSQRRLEVYTKLWQEGQFRPVVWASATCKETGGTYRVNGKHTSVMVAAQEKIPNDFFVTIERYSCDTLEDVARLYSTFDSKMQSRSTRDINASFAATLPELSEVSVSCLSLAVSGMSYATWMDPYTQIQSAERAELILEHPKFVVWLHDLIGNQRKAKEDGRQSAKHLNRAAVAAAMFKTWQKDLDDALIFWLAVRDETGTDRDHPDRRLARFLLNTVRSDSRQFTQREKKSVSNREMFSKCLQAWNAWRQDKATVTLQFRPDAEMPVVG
jgi:hypothetical protein